MTINDDAAVLAAAIERKRAAAKRERRTAKYIAFALVTFVLFAISGAVSTAGSSYGLGNVPSEAMAFVLNYTIISAIRTSLLTVGAVAIALWLVQIAITFARYHLRLANAFDAQADAIMLSKGDPERLRIFAAALSPESVAFGKMPTTVYEKAFDVIQELASRVGPKGG